MQPAVGAAVCWGHMWLCICFPVWRSLIPYTFCFGRKESQGERWRDYFFVKIWGMDVIWLTCHGACGLIAIQDGKCLREELWKSSGNVVSSLECTQSAGGQEGAEVLLRFLQDLWKHDTIACFLSLKKQALEIPHQQSIWSLAIQSVGEMKTKALNASSTKVVNIWRTGTQKYWIGSKRKD